MQQWKMFPFPAAPASAVGFRCLLSILNAVFQCMLETLHHGATLCLALVSCSWKERNERQASSSTRSKSPEGCPGTCQDRALKVLRSLLTPAEDNYWQCFTSPLCLTAFLQPTAVQSKNLGGFSEEGLRMHQGTTCQAICSCTQALLGACAALKPCQCPVQPCRRAHRIRCWKLERSRRHKAELFLVQVFSMSCIWLFVADCHWQTFSTMQAKPTPGSTGRELPLFL